MGLTVGTVIATSSLIAAQKYPYLTRCLVNSKGFTYWYSSCRQKWKQESVISNPQQSWQALDAVARLQVRKMQWQRDICDLHVSRGGMTRDVGLSPVQQGRLRARTARASGQGLCPQIRGCCRVEQGRGEQP
ncbi:uncharacterized protein LJ206_002193 isoform 1-T1 [Theristicus caerulescens]